MKAVRSVERAISVLSFVAQSDEPVGLTDISQATGIDKATVLRLLATLEVPQLIQRDPATRRYTVGAGMWQMLTSWRSDLRSVSRPFLESLRRVIEETITLVCPRGFERVVVESLAGPHQLCVVPVVGTSQPIYSGASGKVLMAYMPEKERERIIEFTGLKPLMGGGLMDPVTFAGILDEVRDVGYAYALGTVTTGVAAIAAPIFDAGSYIIGAISVRGPESRMPVERIEAMAPLVMRAAQDISRQLGYRGAHATAAPDSEARIP